MPQARPSRSVATSQHLGHRVPVSGEIGLRDGRQGLVRLAQQFIQRGRHVFRPDLVE
jgi:hypothetical protein